MSCYLDRAGGKSLGLTKKGLEDLALVTLRAKLPPVKVVSSPRAPFIYIQANVTSTAAHVKVQLRNSFFRIKTPWGKKEIVVQVVLWNRSVLLSGGLKPTMRRRIREVIEEFLPPSPLTGTRPTLGNKCVEAIERVLERVGVVLPGGCAGAGGLRRGKGLVRPVGLRAAGVRGAVLP